jgi:hypothetical protein
MGYPLESGRRKEGIQDIQDTGKCLEAREELGTEGFG